MSYISLNTIKASILGLAIGDALGVPVEFCPREKLDANPVTGMRGNGTHPVPAGAWSDDTSMTLCALDALAQEQFTWDSVMENFGKWYYKDEFTPTGKMFDVGSICRIAIDDYFNHHMDVDHCGCCDDFSNGNGSLMRIIPFALYAPDDLPFIEKASCLTHAHRRCQIACGIYSLILSELIDKREIGAYRFGLNKAKLHYGSDPEWRYFAPLFEIESRNRDSVRSSGYVIDTLEAALWCLVTTGSYRACVLKAVNLGSDTDTVAAVAGGFAGVVYGLEGIPQEWLNTLLKREFIEELCQRASQRWECL